MKKALLAAALVLLALPLSAQTSQFGILFGGVKRLNDLPNSQGQRGINDFQFGDSVKEVFFSTRLEPDTMFKIKVGQVTLPVVYDTGAGFAKVNGKIDHIDAVVDYRFSEAFGSGGIFGGLGMYRSSAPGVADDTNGGLNAGANADFPLSRRYGIVVEGTYHWVRTTVRQRFITATAGVRISF